MLTGMDVRLTPDVDASPLDRDIGRALAALRAAALTWAAIAAFATRTSYRSLWLAAAVLALLALASLSLAVASWPRPSLLAHPAVVLGELALGIGANLLDAPLHRPGLPNQTLASVWPLAGVLAAGQHRGALAGASAGAAMGVARTLGVLAAGPAGSMTSARWLSLASTTALYVLGGGVAGFTGRRLRRAEQEISVAKAREEVARTLHDGVLQTLSAVQRRSHDASLVRLARDQELDLRTFLFGASRQADGLAPALRKALAQHERRFGGTTELVVVEHPEWLGGRVVEALVGAVTEAVTNAAKHGCAERITVCVDLDDTTGGVFCSVHDNGRGFDVSATPDGVGLERSIKGRLAEVGGRVEIASRPGRGTEVRLWAR